MEKPCELLETLLSIRGKKEDNQQLSSIKKKNRESSTTIESILSEEISKVLSE